MPRRIVSAVVGIVVAAVVAVALQTAEPKATVETVLENERVIVQRAKYPAGVWAGEHTHKGEQLHVIIKGGTITVREGGVERTVTTKAGDVLWTKDVTHDLRAEEDIEVVLVTVK